MLRLRRALPSVAMVIALPMLPIMAIAGPGCDTQKSSPSVTAAPPPTGLPPLDPAAKTAVAAPGDRPQHGGSGALPAGHPTVGGAGQGSAMGTGGTGGMGANPHGAMGGGGGMGGMGGMEGTTPANIPFDPKSVISGELRVDAKVKDKVKAGDTIFLVVRSVDKPGPPLAVKKLTVGAAWPLAFTVDGRDAMFPGTQLAGKVSVNVRVDKDGDAITKNPGDVTGTASIVPPADKLVVTLDTVL